MAARPIPVLLLGNQHCGKTTFLSRVSQGHDRLSGKTPQGLHLLKDIDQPFDFEIRSRKGAYRLEFFDTSCPHDWRLLRPDLVVVCYDISQRQSLVDAQSVWIKEIRTTFEASDVLPILLLGLKRDLRSESDPNGTIYPQEGYRTAQEMRADKYIECSAVSGELLPEAFEDICRTALKTTEDGGGQSDGTCSLM